MASGQWPVQEDREAREGLADEAVPHDLIPVGQGLEGRNAPDDLHLCVRHNLQDPGVDRHPVSSGRVEGGVLVGVGHAREDGQRVPLRPLRVSAEVDALVGLRFSSSSKSVRLTLASGPPVG